MITGFESSPEVRLLSGTAKLVKRQKISRIIFYFIEFSIFCVRIVRYMFQNLLVREFCKNKGSVVKKPSQLAILGLRLAGKQLKWQICEWCVQRLEEKFRQNRLCNKYRLSLHQEWNSGQLYIPMGKLL
jgi:hypothetical protein